MIPVMSERNAQLLTCRILRGAPEMRRDAAD